MAFGFDKKRLGQVRGKSGELNVQIASLPLTPIPRYVPFSIATQDV